MPVHIGPPPSSADVVDVVDILLACHDRIRRFSDAAVRLAVTPPGTGDEEIRDAATRIRYYFRAAYPAHVEDEDDTLLPRLHGLSAEVDAALATMEHDHDAHGRDMAHLLRLCDALVEAPARHAVLAAELGEVAAALRDDFARHLAMEELTLFPAVRTRLPHAVQAEMLYEARARRGDG